MRRILLDTNIYGLIVVDTQRGKIIDLITSSKLLIYGTKLNRQELRAVPGKTIIDGKNLRIDLLSLFDKIIGNHIYNITQEMKQTAESYYKAYIEFGGSKSKEEMINDFCIVACATMHNLDILVSNDEKTMSSENALRSYNLVNSILNKKTPKFIKYEEFKKMI